jgi:hypothetical protein
VTLSPTQLGEGTHLIHWVGPQGSYGVTAANVFADLALEAESVVISGSQISLLVTNDGNLASTGGAVVVYDRLPGSAGAQELARLPLPSIAAGKYAMMEGVLNLAAMNLAAASTTGLFYVRLEPPAGSPDLNPANDLYVVGDLANAQPVETPSSLYFPMLNK